MISNARVFESKKFLREPKLNNFPDCDYFYPFSRQGLYVYLKGKKYKTVLLPSYVAEGVFDPFKELGYKITFYDVNENGYLSSSIFENSVDVFVYIHYFGLYNESNLALIKEYQNCFSLFVEDFSHIVYHGSLRLNGDIGLFSFTKIFGVTEGSCIKFNILEAGNAEYVENRTISSKLRRILYWNKVLESYCKNIKINGCLAKCLSVIGLKDYYSLLMSSYRDNYPSMSPISFNVLSRLDMEMVVRIRKHYAMMYLDGLHPRLLLDIPRSYYEKEALFAFPIKVRNRDLFIKILKKSGIIVLTLTNRWWFNEQGDKSLYNSHVLLPINHNLKEKSVKKVIKRVNEVFVKIGNNE